MAKPILIFLSLPLAGASALDSPEQPTANTAATITNKNFKCILAPNTGLELLTERLEQNQQISAI